MKYDKGRGPDPGPGTDAETAPPPLVPCSSAPLYITCCVCKKKNRNSACPQYVRNRLLTVIDAQYYARQKFSKLAVLIILNIH